MRHRNPYVILGIPFGSSREQANIAFARRARPLRRAGAAGRDQLTDLTWALNQVDEGLAHPESAMEIYRIPADPEAVTATGKGVLAPPPEPLPPRLYDRDRVDSARQWLVAAAAHEYLCYLVRLRAGQVSVPAP